MSVKPNRAVWYTEQVVGINTIKKTIKRMLGEANIEGYFMNHSLRRTWCTRLFQAGIDRKIVKEVSGQTSDAIDKYQLTSETQKVNVSKVLAKKPDKSDYEQIDENVVDCDKFRNIPLILSVKVNGKTACSCQKTYSSDASIGQNVADLIKGIVEANRLGKKMRIKIDIEVDN